MMETNKRVLKVAESIAKKVEEGYELLEKGMGDYTSIEASYKSKGYVTYGWYTLMTKEVSQRQYVIYGRSKKVSSPKTQTKVEINYEDKTVKELKELCKMQKVAGYSKMNKQQMIESLSKAC